VETAANVWVPPDYAPSVWELATPPIVSLDDAEYEYDRCRRSAGHFIFHHCWTIHVDDPSGAPTFRKFPVYPFLRRFFREAQPQQNLHVEKSRQMTMSWAWMALFLWDVLFHDRWPDLVVSRRAVDVDDGGSSSTPDSLMGKVRLMLTMLPVYLQPLNAVVKQFQISIPDNKSWIRGETGTRSAGRGPTYRRALLDEAAYIEGSESIFKAVRQSAKNGTCLNSTPNGKANVFARVRFNPRSTFKKLSFWWPRHPVKAEGLYCTCGWKFVLDLSAPVHLQIPIQAFHAHDCGNLKLSPPRPRECRSAWYDEACRDYTPEQTASELDISYERSRRGRVYEGFDSTLHVFDHQLLRQPDGTPLGERRAKETLEDYHVRYLRAALDPLKPLVVGWDFGVSDPSSLLLGQILDEKQMVVRWIDEHEHHGESWDYYHRHVTKLWWRVWVELGGEKHYPMEHYGDPSGKNRASDLTSWVSNLAGADPPIRIQSVETGTPGAGSPLEWIDFIHVLIRGQRVLLSSWCAHLIDTLEQYRWPTTAEGELLVGSAQPVHDQYSHTADALRYVYRVRFLHRLKTRERPGMSMRDILTITEVEEPTNVFANTDEPSMHRERGLSIGYLNNL
jgi:hypothetical protein